jgi:hypothetical protein
MEGPSGTSEHDCRALEAEPLAHMPTTGRLSSPKISKRERGTSLATIEALST